MVSLKLLNITLPIDNSNKFMENRRKLTKDRKSLQDMMRRQTKLRTAFSLKRRARKKTSTKMKWSKYARFRLKTLLAA